MLTDFFFFFSAQEVLIFSKQNFQVANEQKFKSCKFAAVVCGERKTVSIESAKYTRMYKNQLIGSCGYLHLSLIA